MAALVAVLSAEAQIYVCGAFNGWDPKNPVEMTLDSDGIYRATIDFGAGVEFKMSTVRGVEGNGWNDFDTGTLYYSGQPQAGVWTDFALTLHSPNCLAPSAAVYTVQIALDDNRILFTTGGDTPATPWSGTLPVLFIDTENNTPVTSKETYLTATYWLDPMGNEDVPAIGSSENPLTTQIKGRGNYTWLGFDKKPYRLKLADKQPLMGMPASKHWALLANADDNSGFMRNATGFEASRQLGMPWTPGSEPCEVVLNGDYIGLYFVTQTIRVDKDRVNIVEQADLATTDVDGGWLVEIDNYDTDPHVTVYENGDRQTPIWFTYKSPEALSTRQSTYLQNAMQAIDNAVYATDKSDATALSALVDLDVLARYYITQELVDDGESFHGSCYLNRNRGAGQRWMFGPVWDFGNALLRGDSRKFIWQDPPFHQVWIGEIYKFGAFQKAVRSVWQAWLDAGGETSLPAYMTAFADKIAAAALCDARRWPQYGNADELARADRARTLVQNRIAWLKEQWGESGVDDITADSATDSPAVYYNLSGQPVASPQPGTLYIVRRGHTVTKQIFR